MPFSIPACRVVGNTWQKRNNLRNVAANPILPNDPTPTLDMLKFKRSRNTAKKTYRYVRDDLLNIDEAQGHYRDIKELAKKNLDPRAQRQGRNETFAHAMERMGLTMDELPETYKFYSFRFNLFAFFLGAAIFLAAWGAWEGRYFVILGSIPASLIFIAHMFNASFRCFQIRHHELLPVSSWWHNKGEWVPGEYRAPRSKSRSLKRQRS